MLIVLVAIIVGLIIGLFSSFSLPTVYYSYVTLIILVSLDSLIEAGRAFYNKNFSNVFFLLKWLSDIVLAVLFKALGDALGVDLAIPIIIYLGMRMFDNSSKLIKTWYKRQQRKRKILEIWIRDEGESTDLPVEQINPDSERQQKVDYLRAKAKNLRIEADSLVSEADTLEEEEAISQLQNIRRRDELKLKTENSTLKSAQDASEVKEQDNEESDDSRGEQKIENVKPITEAEKLAKETKDLKHN